MVLFNVLATYIHNIDPFAIQFTESFGIRWYGVAYVLGFVAAYFLLCWFVRLRACELKQSEVTDFITMAALFGVMLGGRLGYLLLYIPEKFFSNPLIFFHFLDGGMASHGGIAGLILFTFVYAKVKEISWMGIGDNLVTVSPVGIFFGRVANFINGELYGRETSHSWAMKFPDELKDAFLHSTSSLHAFVEERAAQFPELKVSVSNAIDSSMKLGLNPHGKMAQTVIEYSNQHSEFRELLGSILLSRHPSQLYEAVLEGLLLFVILLIVRLRWKNLYHGILTGLFFMLYAIGRIIAEGFREPDAEMIGGLTRGQFYSTFMILIGLGFIFAGIAKKQRNRVRD